MDFGRFDARGYPTLSVRDGYREWAPSYERVVGEILDLRLLERVTTLPWREIERALDLACGTGRIGRWLRARGVGQVDGVDLTPEMLARARDQGGYEHLTLADICCTGLAAGGYDLVTEVLACEHVATLDPLYGEAARLLRPGGWFVIVGYHPHFLLNGIPTHFDRPGGESVAIESHVHLLSDHVKAAHAERFSLLEMDEGVVDQDLLAQKPQWAKHAYRPVSFAMVWQRPAAPVSTRRTEP